MLVDYKGLQVSDLPLHPDIDALVDNNMRELADRVGPVVELGGDPTINDDSGNTSGNGTFYKWSKVRNNFTGQFWTCTDDTPGASVWCANGLIGSILTTVGNAQTTIATIAVPDDTVFDIEVHFVARRTDAPGRAAYTRRALFYREAGGGVVREKQIDSVYTRESSGSWNATLVASGDDILIQVKGQNGATINWHCKHTINSLR